MSTIHSSKTYQITALQFDKLRYENLINHLSWMKFQYEDIQIRLQAIYKLFLSIVIENKEETSQITCEIESYLHELNQLYLKPTMNPLHGYYVNKPQKTIDFPIYYSQTKPSRPFILYIYPLSTLIHKGVKHYQYRYLYTTYNPLTNVIQKKHTGTFSLSAVQKKVSLLPFFLELEFTCPNYETNDLFFLTNRQPTSFFFQYSQSEVHCHLLSITQDSLGITEDNLSCLTCETLQSMKQTIQQYLSAITHRLRIIQTDTVTYQTQQTNIETLLKNYQRHSTKE